ncbi:MAG: hypothetical protein PVJ73_06800 [Acidobacteriota bacterium]|jgi:hypothetical protein|nr:hypothetical protein [Acidobacteriota bacterium]
MPQETAGRRDDESQVPLFGTWPRIYGAVVVSALVVMMLLTLFSGWPF